MTRTSTSAPPRAALAAALLLAGPLLLSACGAEPRGAPAPEPFQDPTRHALHVGLDESGGASSAIGRVVAARVTDGGKHVLVLDFVAPYVKVFGADGRFQTAFLAQGGGPGEARRPVALAVHGDSLAMVADASQSLSVFDLRGNLRGQARVPGLLPLAAAAACPGEWLVYGPRRERDTPPGQATWLHRVKIAADGSAQVRSLVLDSIFGRLSAGLPYGLVPDGDGAVVRHPLGPRPVVLRMDCAGGEPRVLHQGERVEAPQQDGRQEVIRAALTPGMRVPGGVATVDGRVVVGEKVLLGKGVHRLDLTLLTGAEPRRLSMEGDYVLEDSRPGVGVLVSTSNPVPQVFLVKPAEFMALFPRR